MVSTRRGKGQSDQSAQQDAFSAPAAKPRKARKAVVTNGDAVNNPKPTGARRLRSDKEAASPLQTLEEPPRKRTAKTPKAEVIVAPPKEEDVFEEEDTGLFFRESFQKTVQSPPRLPVTVKSEPSAIDLPVTVDASTSTGDFAVDAATNTDPQPECFCVSAWTLHRATAERDNLRKEVLRYRGEVRDLTAHHDKLKETHESLIDELELLKKEQWSSNAQIRKLERAVADKTSLINFLNTDKTNLRNQLDAMRENTQQLLRTRHSKSPIAVSELTGEELLERIENRRRPNPRRSSTTQQNGTYDGGEDAMIGIDRSSATPAATATPATEAEYNTPRSAGWGFKSFFGRIIPSAFRSSTPAPPIVAPPATAPPRPLNSNEIQELNDSLVHIDTPSRKPVPKSRSKPKRSKTSSSKRIIPNQRAIITRVTQNVKPEQKSGAIEWAKKQAEVLAAQGSLGDKRKRLENPLKLKDVHAIPSSLPWQSGSYGLLDDFWGDESDEDVDAPEWYKLEQLANEPPAKRQRVRAEQEEDSSMMDTASSSMNGAATSSRRRATSNSMMRTSPHASTETLTCSPKSINPRPSVIPSPMFMNPVMHRSGDNVFDEQIEQSPQTDFISGSFSIPNESSDEEDQEQANGSSSPWTQAPPPAPAPAHASLPTPITATPSVPAMSAETFFPPSDPVKDARKEAMRYTPAKPSGLRNVISQSPIPGSLHSKLSQAKALSYPDGLDVDDAELDALVNATFVPNQVPSAQFAWNPPPIADHIFKDDAEMMELIKNAPNLTGNEPWALEMRAGLAAAAAQCKPLF
ncbi:hypothetical protein B0J11DRAFT_250496 [Dendryphion nanum]|uniref:Uncharacterized protein n=1 Tax=Dendryphion nanum TaxID=256645 RepID=A0A9P9IRD1_9PLEO|nr:hypothetical protein B0J11DRAFT_250496 [Dendryphion nanum]